MLHTYYLRYNNGWPYKYNFYQFKQLELGFFFKEFGVFIDWKLTTQKITTAVCWKNNVRNSDGNIQILSDLQSTIIVQPKMQ